MIYYFRNNNEEKSASMKEGARYWYRVPEKRFLNITCYSRIYFDEKHANMYKLTEKLFLLMKIDLFISE